MTNSNNDIEELEELLTELEGQEARIITPYSEEDDAVTRLMDAPLGDQDWMVQVTALDRRMMSTPQLLSELQAGRVSSRTLVWRGGMSDWLPVARIDELSRASAAPVSAPRAAFTNLAPPPPPPPQPSRPMWASPAPSAPLPPPPVAMAPPIGMAPLQNLPSSPGLGAPGRSSAGFGMAPPMALTPPPPAPSAFNMPMAAAVSASPSVAPSSQSNTTRPVAIDFGDMMPENDPPLQSKRWVMALSAVAILAVFVTVYSLSSGGGESEAKESAAAAQPKAMSSLQPAVAKDKPAPSAAPAPEAPKAETPEKPAEAPVATATAKPSADDEDESRSDESRASSASTRQARYALRAEARRRARGASASSERSRDDEREEAAPTPERAPARAAAAPVRSTAPAAEEEAPAAPASEPAADEVDDAPKSTAKSGSTFNRDAAKTALDEAAEQAKNCRPQGGPSGTGRVQVRYEPSGKVSNVTILTSKFDNTTTGSCVRMLFRRAKVPEFTGAPVVVVNKSFDIP